MAQKQVTAKPKRRVVKQVETMRTLTEKNQQEKPEKGGFLRLVGTYIAAPFVFVGRPIGKLGRFKIFRFVGLIFVPRYFRNSWKELKQVTWPTRRESWQLTSAVILFAVVFGVMIALVDFGLDKLFKQVLLK